MSKRNKPRHAAKYHLPNIDHLMVRLKEANPHQAVEAVMAIPPDMRHWAKPTVPLLLRVNSWLSLRAACLIGPEREEDFVLLLRSIADARGSMTPDLVTLLQQSGPEFENCIETIAGFLQHPHYRVRIAAARALRGMGVLLELIEPSLLKALDDPSAGVVEAVLETLMANEGDLTPTLSSAMTSSPVTVLSARKRAEFDLLERQMWWPRTKKLNSADADEDVILIYCHKTPGERSLPQRQLIERLLTAHGLPPAADAFHETSFEHFHVNLREALTSIYHGICADRPTEELASRFRALFHDNAVLLGNRRYVQYDKDGTVAYCGTVTGNITDHGVICHDDEYVGFFFVSDED